jgi:multidrug efflux pump subunit AcrB
MAKAYPRTPLRRAIDWNNRSIRCFEVLRIENAIATRQGVKHIYTTVHDGGVAITVEFQLGKPVQEAVDDVRSAIASIRADLRDPVV